ncbi:MAG: protein translocase subunit SecD [Alphaproteobacteria bacterium]|nr:protein translocase subunit SecD [Alphaproteobacteria bacterium]
MIHFPPWKIALAVIVCLLGVVYALPNLLSEQTAARLPGWLPHKQLVLGLDLQGGSHLLLEVDTDSVLKDRLNSLVDGVRTTLRKDRSVQYTGLALDRDAVVFRLNDPAKIDPVSKAIREDEPDAEVANDGPQFRIGFRKAELDAKRRSAIEQSIEIVRRRIDEMGTREPIIQRQGESRILVQLPGVKDPERVKDILGRTAKLTFRFVDEETSLEDAKAGRIPPSSELLKYEERGGAGSEIVVRRRIMVSGENLTNARASYDEYSRPAVSFKFDSVGARRFGEATRDNVGKLFAIVLDNKVISAPRIQTAILGGSGIITGSFTTQQAQDLALLLNAGALPAPLKIIEERSVGPELGADSIQAGVYSCIVGLALVVLYMVGAYGLFGLFANVALILNLVMIIGVLSVLGATLTLPGIAGILLTLGMAVDANVLVNERIREETRAGRSPLAAIDIGYTRAWATIIDSNLTTIIKMVLLYSFGSGSVKGFAVTITIGILTSMFTAILVVRMIMVAWIRQRRTKLLPV